jgi:hypothetical protein
MARTYKRLVPWLESETCGECGWAFKSTGAGRTRLETEWEHECACGLSWLPHRYPRTIYLPEGDDPNTGGPDRKLE